MRAEAGDIWDRVRPRVRTARLITRGYADFNKEAMPMPENQTPPSKRRRYRRREIKIEAPKLRQMAEQERRTGEGARTADGRHGR